MRAEKNTLTVGCGELDAESRSLAPYNQYVLTTTRAPACIGVACDAAAAALAEVYLLGCN